MTEDGLTLKDFMPKSATGNVPLLLHEIRHALRKLAETGERTVIDLGGIPMFGTEIEEFDRMLGRGEVSATIEAGGPTEIWETEFPGVWRVIHRTAEGLTLARQIEIATVPDILAAQPSDIAAGLARLSTRLAYEYDQEDAK
ncbi:hydrogenase expression/formation C-terminal domain-containing protein [Thioclava pacifica]|uniref:HupH hydrogenase expression protein C-terminal domain-containing protein n=1 Tax=Thioclava pacifica DSM 10166 TaxID=1353537 RepID=A0A074J0I2_9RHOB|nr:hydrogenase expression/formation C-terminal domain-containing protein [Thioclava pacifica]KEO50891.1 hypothetical protein TP2_13465 [Thioclava pacifica DSM 10166]